MRIRAAIAGLLCLPVNAVLFGAGAVTVLSIPALREHATTLIPSVVAMSLILSVPLAWKMAPRMRARYWN